MTDLYLYGSVGEDWWGGECFTALEVANALKPLRGPITVHLNSGGGVASEGAAIYALLTAYPGRIKVIVDGIAASAASLIAMAGDEIIMPLGSYLVIHDPAIPVTDGRGTAADHLASAAMLETVSFGYAEIYAQRSGSTLDEARALMKAETFLNGEAAVTLGYATRVDTGKAQAAAAFDYRIYANAPPALREASERFGTAQSREAILAKMAGTSRRTESGMNVRVNPPGDDPAKTEVEPKLEKTDRAILTSAAAAGLPAKFAMDLINSKTPVDEAINQITAEWVKAGGPDDPMFGREPARIGMSHDSPQAVDERLGDALACRIADRIGLNYTPTKGREFVSMDVPGMIEVSARARGDRIKMAGGYQTASDFSLSAGAAALTNIAKVGFEAKKPALMMVANKKDVSDYRTGFAVTLSGSGALQTVPEGANLQYVVIDENGEAKAAVSDVAALMRVSNQAMANDATAMGLLADVGQKVITGAVQTARAILVAPLLANSGAGQTLRDTNPVFHSSRGNLAGTTGAPSVTTLGAARTSMARLKDSQGNVLALTPQFLVVPPELQTTAEQVVASITANSPSGVNPFSGKLEVIVEPALTSTTAWYLVADPFADEGLAYAFLNGQESPIVESKEGWNTLGVEYRVTWAMGAAFHGWRGWYRNAG